MNSKDLIHHSKFLSLVLRHQPQTIGITLDANGWVDVDLLLEAMSAAGKPLSADQLAEVVATSDKQRFALSEDGRRIRANQGHSVEVDLGYAPAIPPAELYHGTADRFVDSIRRVGLIKGKRHHVHLSQTPETASKVGQRHGKLVLLTVRSGAMHIAGHAFFLTPNAVWLTETVPTEFVKFPFE